MLFNSIAFLVFLPVVWACYHALRTASARIYLLLAASYVFYMWWRVDLAALLVLSTLTDYLCGLSMGRWSARRARRIALAVSLTVNLSLLATFKYWKFFAGEFTSLGGLFIPGFELPVLDLVLPMGISFYTFQTLSYTIEVFRGRISPERNLARFALYVSFFPQLVAGPIERPSRLLPQIRSPREADAPALVAGLRLILWGMFKKVVVADRLAIYVDLVYGEPAAHNGAQLSLATAFFAMQIYCDFSGYCDIAIGCAKTLGFDLMNNFRRPYLAWCPTEFWRRWHISLSTWFRDYVYFPLGGSRGGVTRGVVALGLTFLVSGLWHGANWTFIVWGAIHGGLVLLERLFRRVVGVETRAVPTGTGTRLLATVVTLSFVSIAWVFFRADSLSSAWYVITHLLTGMTMTGISCGLYAPYLLTSVALVAVVLGFDVWEEWRATSGDLPLWDVMPAVVRWGGYWSLATITLLLGQLSGTRQFIYFQF